MTKIRANYIISDGGSGKPKAADSVGDEEEEVAKATDKDYDKLKGFPRSKGSKETRGVEEDLDILDRPGVNDCDAKAFGESVAANYGYFFDTAEKTCNVIRPAAFPLLRLAKANGDWDEGSGETYLPQGAWIEAWAPSSFFSDPTAVGYSKIVTKNQFL